jgi:hypothetical protein
MRFISGDAISVAEGYRVVRLSPLDGFSTARNRALCDVAGGRDARRARALAAGDADDHLAGSGLNNSRTIVSTVGFGGSLRLAASLMEGAGGAAGADDNSPPSFCCKVFLVRRRRTLSLSLIPYFFGRKSTRDLESLTQDRAARPEARPARSTR